MAIVTPFGSTGNAGAPPPAPPMSSTGARAAGAVAAGPPLSAATPTPVPPQQQPSDPTAVRAAVSELKQWIETKAPNALNFSIDEDTGRTVVKIIDTETGEVIRQIPAEELLAIARSLEKMQGLLLRQEA